MKSSEVRKVGDRSKYILGRCNPNFFWDFFFITFMKPKKRVKIENTTFQVAEAPLPI